MAVARLQKVASITGSCFAANSGPDSALIFSFYISFKSCNVAIYLVISYNVHRCRGDSNQCNAHTGDISYLSSGSRALTDMF